MRDHLKPRNWDQLSGQMRRLLDHQSLTLEQAERAYLELPDEPLDAALRGAIRQEVARAWSQWGLATSGISSRWQQLAAHEYPPDLAFLFGDDTVHLEPQAWETELVLQTARFGTDTNSLVVDTERASLPPARIDWSAISDVLRASYDAAWDASSCDRRLMQQIASTTSAWDGYADWSECEDIVHSAEVGAFERLEQEARQPHLVAVRN